MGATRNLESTHDVGARISGTRPPISEKLCRRQSEKYQASRGKTARMDMQDVCSSCPQGWIDNWYVQYDNVIDIYNNKFARPATELYNMIERNV
jgi:hypothetical protein